MTTIHASLHRTIAIASCVITFALATNVSAGELVKLPRDLEISLALSALPENLQDAASVYVLDPEYGYLKHRRGTNGFVTFVGRTSVRFIEAGWVYEYPSDQLIPIAYDSIGAQEHMAPWFDLAKMRAEGVSPEEAKSALRKRYADGAYRAPTKGGISYMLVPIHRAYQAPEGSAELTTVSFPHYMPYAPHVTSAQLGNDNPMNGGPFALNHGGSDTGPHGYMIFMTSEPQTEAIRQKYADLLKQLCALHENWCLGKAE